MNNQNKKTIKETTVKLRILFGGEAVSLFFDDGTIDTSLGDAFTKEFQTEAEAKAYIQGMEDAVGWDEYAIMETAKQIKAFDHATKEK
ncbi:MAG: hypothetical protein MJZ11_10700 [Lachnospiraceae bacterium]|nr:hypothetical protein [Lachnospiraceae bacterium]